MKATFSALLGSIFVIVLASVVLAADKITICHAAGRDDTTKFVTLTISEHAVYGPGGHFNEDGTPQAGHEQDYLGACVTDPIESDTPSESPVNSPSIDPTPSVRPTPTIGTDPTPTPEVTPTPSNSTPTLPPTDT